MFGLLLTFSCPWRVGKCSVDAIAVSGSLVLERVQMSLHDQTDKIVVKYNELFSVQYSLPVML